MNTIKSESDRRPSVILIYFKMFDLIIDKSYKLFIR